jgi:hypothetical protein
MVAAARPLRHHLSYLIQPSNQAEIRGQCLQRLRYSDESLTTLSMVGTEWTLSSLADFQVLPT